jgi:hypothetical protein
LTTGQVCVMQNASLEFAVAHGTALEPCSGRGRIIITHVPHPYRRAIPHELIAGDHLRHTRIRVHSSIGGISRHANSVQVHTDGIFHTRLLARVSADTLPGLMVSPTCRRRVCVCCACLCPQPRLYLFQTQWFQGGWRNACFAVFTCCGLTTYCHPPATC